MIQVKFKNVYIIVNFSCKGTKILSINVNNIYERIIFMKKDNAIKYIKRLGNKPELSIFEIDAYTNNKLLYENNMDYIDDIDDKYLKVV